MKKTKKHMKKFQFKMIDYSIYNNNRSKYKMKQNCSNPPTKVLLIHIWMKCICCNEIAILNLFGFTWRCNCSSLGSLFLVHRFPLHFAVCGRMRCIDSFPETNWNQHFTNSMHILQQQSGKYEQIYLLFPFIIVLK